MAWVKCVHCGRLRSSLRDEGCLNSDCIDYPVPSKIEADYGLKKDTTTLALEYSSLLKAAKQIQEDYIVSATPAPEARFCVVCGLVDTNSIKVMRLILGISCRYS